MGISGIVSIIIIAVTSYVSYKGFKSSNFYASLEFEVERFYFTAIIKGWLLPALFTSTGSTLFLT